MATWLGERNRVLQVRRPCQCGCDGDDRGVGYITGSDAEGNGFTLWIKNEEEYVRVERIINDNRRSR